MNQLTALPSLVLSPKSRRLVAVAAAALSAVFLLWAAVHHVPGAGPWVADTLRAVVGVEAVARLEDAAYGVRDQVNQVVRSHETPKAYWDASPVTAEPTLEPAPHVPRAVGALFTEVAASGDGQWVAVDGPEAPVMHKTLLHPDPKRTWAELFVVAIDMRHARLHYVPGTAEPKNEAPGAGRFERSGFIPPHVHEQLLAAFNGGFKTQHGHFGAQVDGVTLVKPRPNSCTVALAQDGNIAIGTWKNLNRDAQWQWLRQTPGCMVEAGELHPGLARADSRHWGATLSGDTVIRRSAIGISEDGQTLYVGISNDTTARALALGMQHAGAFHVAQLDVNYSYPKFVTFDGAADAGVEPRLLVPGFAMRKGQYLSAEVRDFFYLTRPASAVTAVSRHASALAVTTAG